MECMGMWIQASEDQALPIKTYEDYGLGKDPKEELKVDPITPLIELLGTLGKASSIGYRS